MAKTSSLEGAVDVRFGSKADMCGAKRHVCFTPNSAYWNALTRAAPSWRPVSFQPNFYLRLVPHVLQNTKSKGVGRATVSTNSAKADDPSSVLRTMRCRHVAHLYRAGQAGS